MPTTKRLTYWLLFLPTLLLLPMACNNSSTSSPSQESGSTQSETMQQTQPVVDISAITAAYKAFYTQEVQPTCRIPLNAQFVQPDMPQAPDNMGGQLTDVIAIHLYDRNQTLVQTIPLNKREYQTFQDAIFPARYDRKVAERYISTRPKPEIRRINSDLGVFYDPEQHLGYLLFSDGQFTVYGKTID